MGHPDLLFQQLSPHHFSYIYPLKPQKCSLCNPNHSSECGNQNSIKYYWAVGKALGKPFMKLKTAYNPPNNALFKIPPPWAKTL